MPRIFKGIESELRLLLHPCILTGEITDIKVALFTNDPSVAIEFTDRYTIDDNILTLKVPTWAFGTMEDGVINYVIQGMHNDDAFITDRQSNYYLKTPTDYIPEEMPEEVVLGEFTTKIVENGVFEYTPTDVDAWNKATIEVNVPDTNGSYDEGYNQGYEDGQNSVECPECPTCNLGEGEIYLTASDAGFYELYAAEDGYDGWSKFYVTLENGGAIKIHKAEELIQWFNEGGDIDFGTYHYVGGKITDIQEVSMEWGNATYTLDNGFKVYRGKWMDDNPFGEGQIKVGGYIVVYGVIADYNGTLQFNAGSQVIAYQECEGGEIVSCNLEDKWVTPSMGDRDDNGLIVVEESEGFDGLSRVVIDPTTIYNEGVTAGKAEGGDLILGAGDIYLTPNERGQRFEIFPSEFEYDAFDKFIVELENFDLGGDANIYEASMVNDLLMDGKISYGNVYLFKGQITEIQRIRPDIGDARYTLDGSLNVYNGQTMGYDIQVGDNVIVIGTLSEYNGAPQFSAGSMIKAWWREGGSCNLEDKWVTPSMSERDDNGLIVVDQSEGYDGLDRVVIDPTTIYNEGIEEGRNQGGGSGDCNIQNQKRVDLNGEWEVYRPDEGYDGVYEFVVDASGKAEEWREEGRNGVRDKLQPIDITENGRYSVDEMTERQYIEFDGNSYFDTNIPFGENTKIEVAITKTTYEEEEQFIGVANFDLAVAETYGGFGIVAGAGLAYGVFGKSKTHNIPFSYEEEQILTLDRNGLNSSLYDTRGWIDESGLVDDTVYGHTIGIGKIKSVSDGWIYRGLNGRIRYVKIWTDGNDDSTLVTFIPKNMAQGGFGMVNSDGVEFADVSNLGEGTTTFISEWERKYGEGWKEINVNVDTQAFYNQGFADATSFNKIAMEIETDVYSKLEFLTDYSFVTTSGDNSPKSLMFDMPINYIWSYRDVSDGIAELRQNAFKDYSKIRKFKTNTIMTLGERAFKDAFELTEIDMSNLIGRIATEAFDGCSKLAKIICRATGNVVLGSAPFNGLPENGVLYLKEGVNETPWLEKLPSGWTVERI